MSYAVPDDHGRLHPAVHSLEPVVRNFCRKWSIVCLLKVILRNFSSVVWQKIFYISTGFFTNFFVFRTLHINPRK